LATEPGLWSASIERAATGPKVLLATSVGGLPTAAIMDSVLAVALTLRGACVHLLLCDHALSACLMTEIGLMTPRSMVQSGAAGYACESCHPFADQFYRGLGLTVHRYSEWLTPTDRCAAAEIAATGGRGTSVEGVEIDEHAMAGALRYFARASICQEKRGEAVLRRYTESAALAAFATKHLIRQHRFSVVSCINGIYVPQGIVASVARSEGCRVVAWSVAYRKKAFIFSHGDTYHHTLLSEPTSEWEDMPWTPERETEIMDYLTSRRRGGRDWIVFQSRKTADELGNIAAELGVDFSKPCIGLLTNVAWDAQLHYPANAFPNMMEWIIRTLEYFERRPDLTLIVRIHPAEISGDIPSRQPVVGEIKRRFPRLPRNIVVIPPESNISTYTVMEACNAVLIYGTKTGVELTSRGVPVIVAGEAWIRNKGITIDARSAAQYFELLSALPLEEKMSPAAITRARKYAYHFFFRRMIPVEVFEPTGTEPRFRLNAKTLSELMPGCDQGLDLICDGILKGENFVVPGTLNGVLSARE